MPGGRGGWGGCGCGPGAAAPGRALPNRRPRRTVHTRGVARRRGRRRAAAGGGRSRGARGERCQEQKDEEGREKGQPASRAGHETNDIELLHGRATTGTSLMTPQKNARCLPRRGCQRFPRPMSDKRRQRGAAGPAMRVPLSCTPIALADALRIAAPSPAIVRIRYRETPPWRCTRSRSSSSIS